MDNVSLLDQQVEDRFFRALFAYPRLVALTADQVVPENFSTQYKAKLWHVIREFWQEFGSCPTLDLMDLILKELYPMEQATLTYHVADKIMRLPVPEWAWIVRKIDEMVRTIRLRKTLFEAGSLLDKGQLVAAEDKVTQTIRDGGLLLGEATDDLTLTAEQIMDISDDQQLFCTPTRIYALDDIIKGLFRKELFIVLAPVNVGKSWAVLHLCESALVTGCYVLYFTLEMGRERVLQRLFQSISGVARPRNDVELDREVQLWDETWSDRKSAEVRTLLDTRKVSGHLRTMHDFGGRLSVREYASGTARVSDLERDIALFDVRFGKLPDVVLVDGLLDMKYTGSSDSNRQRLGLTQVARELRGMAKEHNCSVVVTHQANRQAIGSNLVGVEHTSESLGIIQVADTAISLNQKRSEYETSRMRLFLLRARNQRKWAVIDVWQNLEIGQFCQMSKLHVTDAPASSSDDADLPHLSPDAPPPPSDDGWKALARARLDEMKSLNKSNT